LRLPKDPRCRALYYLVPRALPNGNLGYVRGCYLHHSDRATISLREYRIARGEESPLVKGLFHWSPSDFTWNPSMTRGLWSYTSSICAGIGAMTPAGRTEPSIVIDVSGRPHPVDEDLHLPGDADCPGDIQADRPIWAPDDSRIAF